MQLTVLGKYSERKSHVIGGCALTRPIRSSATRAPKAPLRLGKNLSHSHLIDQTDSGIWHPKVETQRRRAVEPRKLKTRQRRKMWLLQRRFVCEGNFFTNFI